MNSVNEAICYGVPMLLLPHQFEQKMIARRVSDLGMGIVINIKNISPTELYKNVKKLISDSKYRKQALKYKSIFKEEENKSHIKAADEILRYID
jgi:UDP:flavonoid glycosyltransferase YjiC (YdhE family)